MEGGRCLSSKEYRGNNGEAKDQYVMLSARLDASYFSELGHVKNSSPLFSDKGCHKCSWRKPGAADTHILGTVARALVNRSGAHRGRVMP